MGNKGLRLLLLLLMTVVLLPVWAQAEEGTGITLPVFTETDCEWDDHGNLISETAHDLNGQPALNSRGFYRAEYTWDAHDNMLTEAYFGLNGEPVNGDAGYARAEYTYDEKERLVAEDRFAADGSRADILGGYSYLRETWDDKHLLSIEYFNASGSLTRPIGGYARILNEYELNGDTMTVTIAGKT